MSNSMGSPAPRKKGSLFKKIVVGLLCLSLIFVGVVCLQPAEYRVSRTATIAAPPAQVFAQINDLHKWEAWSPWAKRDPNAKNSYEGPESGTGAIMKWSGNSDVGEGSLKIVDSKPNELIKVKLDFVRPFESTADVKFDFKPKGDQTEVTWSMEGKNNFLGKAFCLFMNMDKMIGTDYEKGLANLNSVVTAADKK